LGQNRLENRALDVKKPLALIFRPPQWAKSGYNRRHVGWFFKKKKLEGQHVVRPKYNKKNKRRVM